MCETRCFKKKTQKYIKRYTQNLIPFSLASTSILYIPIDNYVYCISSLLLLNFFL